jgi:hypothetical protein
MDGLSALSVAASVTQFIEFGCSLVSKSKEIYASREGASIRQIEMESATRRLVELSGRMKASAGLEAQASRVLLAENVALDKICEGCTSLAQELICKLEKLRVQDGARHRKFKSFRQALKSVWSKGAVEGIARRLNAYQKELDAHILVGLR